MSGQRRDPAALRAYVACGYLLGRRGAELTAGLASAATDVPLAVELRHPEQGQRARALADALTEVVRAIQEQRLL